MVLRWRDNITHRTHVMTIDDDPDIVDFATAATIAPDYVRKYDASILGVEII
jgi:hypothetical protein